MNGKAFLNNLMSNPAYQASVERRALEGTLPPAIEELLWELYLVPGAEEPRPPLRLVPTGVRKER